MNAFEKNRKEALAYFKSSLSKGEIDKEFLPYLRLWMKYKNFVPYQSCIGHVYMPKVQDKKWGYIALYVRDQALPKLISSDILAQPWLNRTFSQLWNISGIPEYLTEDGIPEIGIAWNAWHWPKPAEYLSALLPKLK